MGFVGSPKYSTEDIEHEIRIAQRLSWSSEFDSSDEIEHELNIVNDNVVGVRLLRF